MCTDDRPEFSEDTRSESTDQPTTPAAPIKSASGPGWHRRTFLKAAALGTAAAALLNADRSGLHFGAFDALADDLSGLNCTANDVRIVGPGIIINEPCACTKTCTRTDGTTYSCFDAQVQFHIINNTGTDRYCVTVHLCPGGGLPQQDIVVGNIPANFDGLKTVTINNYPCSTGLVCFGAAGSQPDGSFLKGEACPAGACCTTISWNVKASDPCPDTTRPISSKCRHQQVCIQGRGKATLDCDTSTTGIQHDCSVPCGGTTTLQLCTTSGTNLGPFTFSLTSSDPSVIITPTSSTATCTTYSVGPITASTTTFTGTVTDNGPCTSTDSVTLTTTPVPTPTLTQTSAECDGTVVLTATAQGGNQAGDTFTFTGASGTVSGNTITLGPQIVDGKVSVDCRTVSVTLTRGKCTSGAASYSFKQCVTTTACP